MASSTSSRVRSRLSSRLQPPALKLTSNKKASFSSSISAPASQSATKRSSWISRLPVELSGVEKMFPFHNAIPSARLTTDLSIESHSWGLVPQAPLDSRGYLLVHANGGLNQMRARGTGEFEEQHISKFYELLIENGGEIDVGGVYPN